MKRVAAFLVMLTLGAGLTATAADASSIVTDGGAARCAALRLANPDDGSRSWQLWYSRRMSC